MKKRSWKTTLSGVFAIVLSVAQIAVEVQTGQPVDVQDLLKAGAAVATGVGLLKAKDKDLTGPTK